MRLDSITSSFEKYSDKLLTERIVQDVRQDNCFDFLRYLFAASLIIVHFCTLTETEQFWFISGGGRVKAFFTITGFLVTYSFLRRKCDILSYARKRFVRIVPAYIACILFCLMIGIAVSSLKIQDFMSNNQTWRYIGTNLIMCNWLEPELPNTFQGNFMPQMNGSLWSMKLEVIFYCLVPFLIYFIGKTKKSAVLLFLAGFIAIYNYVPVQIQYFTYFISGMTLLIYFDTFTKHIRWLLPASILLFLPTNFIQVPVITPICCIIEPVTFPMMLVGIAYCFKPLNYFRKFDNITYGLYLYHFPVIQTLILLDVVSYSKLLALFLSFALTAVLACCSWFLIEKPLMSKY